MDRSDFFRKGRFLDYDRFLEVGGVENIEDLGAKSVWPSTERPPDPMAFRIRRLMAKYLTENHYKVLEDTYFLMKPLSEQARERGTSRQSVQNMLNRAKQNLLKVIAE